MPAVYISTLHDLPLHPSIITSITMSSLRLAAATISSPSSNSDIYNNGTNHALSDLSRAQPGPTTNTSSNPIGTNSIPPEATPIHTPKTHRTKWRVLSNCLMGFGNGFNDSAPGALIPYMEKHYSIGYAIVSLIFVTNAVGFLSAAPLTHLLETRLGRSGAYMVAEALMAAGYIIIICTPPYACVVVSFFLIGFGEAFDLALNNVYCANVGNGTTALGLLHGGYGVGGTVGPLVATAIASSGAIWSRFYAVAVSIAVLNGVYAGYIFWGYQQDDHSSVPAPASATTAPAPNKKQLLGRAVKSPVTILGAIFIFAYQGAEVSISGWIISFLVSVRGGDLSAVGNVTAGFWGGIAVGRFLLSPVAYRIGEKVSVAVFTLGCLGFQFLVWFVPSVVGDAVAVAIIGLLLGPVYPCATAVFSRLLPRNLQLTSLGFISSAGSSGGAVWPLATGLIAQKKGTWVLHPICIGLYGAMVCSWFLLPKERKRDE